jgi:hypothetical protein
MPAVSAPGRLRQEEREFEASLRYVVRTLSQKQKQKETGKINFNNMFFL